MNMETKNDSKTTETEVKLADLIIDPKLQMRAKPHDGQYIMDLLGVIQAGTLTEPIVVFRDPTNGSYLVADGHARVDATRSSGCATIRARVHEGGFREALVFALGANATHGVRRTNADLRHTVLTALADPKIGNWSNVQIAQVCLCSDTFVGIVRNKLAPASGNALGARHKGRDGKSYPAKLPRRAAGSHGPTLNGGTSVAVSLPPSMTRAPASTDGGAGSTLTVTKGVRTKASQGGQRAEVTTPTNSMHVVRDFVGVMPVEQTAALPGDSSHAVAARGEGEPTTVQTPATVLSDATVDPDTSVVSTPEDVIPSIATPLALGEDVEKLLGELLSTCTKIYALRLSQPEVAVREDLVREAREKVVRCLDECYPDTRDTVHGKLTDAPARFYEMMGYNPRPGHASDEAILGVLAEELNQECLTA